MGRTIEVGADAVVVRLTGLTALGALKRRLVIPIGAIRSVSTGPYRPDGLRLGGASIPFTDIREGRFRRRRRWTFLSFENRNRTVALTLDRGSPGTDYDVVVLGADDPEAVADAIEEQRTS